MEAHTRRIGDFSLVWGESLCWDDRKERLYFVDCVTRKLLWLDGAEPPLRELSLPSLPTATGLAEDGRVIVALDDGLHLVDADGGTSEMLTPYPEGLGARANDGTVDGSGEFVTGTLRAEQGKGTTWFYSSRNGWSKLDGGITNANGHVSISSESGQRLIFADSPAQQLLSYDITSTGRSSRSRKVFADTRDVDGFPDGACQTQGGGVLSCIIRSGVLALYDETGLQRSFDAGSEQPSDVTFGGSALDRLFVVSIKVDFGHGKPLSPLAGALVEVQGTGLRGVPENRFRL